MLLDCIFEVDYPIDASNAADTEVYFEVYCETFRMDSGKTSILNKKKYVPMNYFCLHNIFESG